MHSCAYSCLVFPHIAKRLGFFRTEHKRLKRNVTQKYKIMGIMYQVNKKDLLLSLPVEAMGTQWSRQVMSKCKIKHVEQSSAVELAATGHCRSSKSQETNSQETTKHRVNTASSGGPCATNHWRLRECNRAVSLYTYTTLTFFSWHLLQVTAGDIWGKGSQTDPWFCLVWQFLCY